MWLTEANIIQTVLSLAWQITSVSSPAGKTVVKNSLKYTVFQKK